MFRSLFVFFAIAGLGAGSASAAEFSFNLGDDHHGVSISHGSNATGRYETGVVGLLDAASGLPQTEGFVASFDDLIQVTVTLGSVLTVPPNTATSGLHAVNKIEIDVGSVDGTVIYTEESLSFYLQGVQVGAGTYLPWGGSGGQLVAGGYLDQASAGLSFDQVLFSARVIQIYDNTLGDWTDTIAISGVVPTLSYFVYVPVPEPATGLLMAGGLAALALAARRHRVG